jgi:class 3 adenylate cyclase
MPVGFIDGQLRPKLPTGVLTLLFADVEGSSQLLTELEDRYGPVMSAIRRIARGAVRDAGGVEVDARADEYFAVFRAAPAALEAAIATQLAMRDHAWPDGRDVRVRIGLHTGRPTATASGYQGISVNAAARLANCGHGGQILVSRSARAALGDETAGSLRHLGTYRLRGIPDEHDIYQAVTSGLLDRFPPLRIDA